MNNIIENHLLFLIDLVLEYSFDEKHTAILLRLYKNLKDAYSDYQRDLINNIQL
jgi:hypothetical protein